VGETLARRSRAGVLAYALLATVIAATTSFGAKTFVAIAAIAGALVIGLARLGITSLHARAGSSPRWLLAFRAGALVSAAYWGTWASLAVSRGIDENALVVLVGTAGIAAGASTSLSPDLRLARAYMVLMLGPVLLVMAMLGTSHARGIAIAVFAFAAFLFVAQRTTHDDFVEAHANADLLAGRATALEQARVRAERAEREASAANRAKSEFLANMSHEIRTPMTAIIGYAELLAARDVGDAERVLHAETIRRNGGHLLRILNDILDLSKIEADKMTVEAAPCSLAEVLSDVDSLMSVRAAERKLYFEVRLATPIPRTIVADPTRVRQILLNLAGNAIKFTDRGSVVVSARYEGGRVSVDVNDTGVGMSAAQTESLFAPFSQVDGSSSRRFQGTGLGLYISRRFARMMGGDVHVTSALGRGSTFTLELPAPNAQAMCTSIRARMPSGDAEPIAADALAGTRVLFAEDGADNQKLVAAFLSRAGATVVLAGDGLAAVRATLDAEREGAPFDVVLMDMEMPVLDGYGATARLRGAGYRGPIIALTAHAMAGHRERCLAAGCDEHATKPIDRAALVATIARFVRRDASAARSSKMPIEPLASSMTDDPDVVDLLDDYLDGLVTRVASLEASSQASDLGTLQRIGHELAGSGGSYGFDAITAAGRALEHAARDRDPNVPALCADLVGVCKRAIAGRARPSRAAS